MFVKGKQILFYSGTALLMVLAETAPMSFAQGTDQSSQQAAPTWKEACQKLPHSGWSTLELQKSALEGDYMAALALARHWMLQGDMGENRSPESMEANYWANKWLDKATPSEHPAVALYRDALAHPAEWKSEDPEAQSEDIRKLVEACRDLARQGDIQAMEALISLLPPPEEDEFAKWARALTTKAEHGDMRAATSLAYLYLFSQAAGDEDIKDGIEFARQSAEAGDPEGMTIFGKALLYDLDSSGRSKEGLAWLHKAAELGQIDAIEILLNTMRNADENDPAAEASAKDQEKKWCRTLCERGQLDMLISRGIELVEEDKDAPGGISMLTRAADQGSFEALDALSKYYQDNDYNVPVDEDKATRYASILANMGGVNGMLKLAKYYETGFGVPRDINAAREWVKKAVDLNFPDAKVEYARFMMKGMGLKEDPIAAFTMLKEVESSYPDTPTLDFMLGYMYEEGLGTPRDLTTAYKYYTQGAEKGDTKAMNNLASMCELGSGMPRNLDEAIKWYGEAAKLGNKDAEVNLKRARIAAKRPGLGAPQS